MTIRFYNTLTQRLEDFEPLVPGKANLYVCGVTTYDLAHAGHARTYCSFDVLARHLRARGYDVTVVRNVTDVDDKILARAKERGEEPLALSSRMSDLVDAQLRTIGVQDPDVEPRVSTSIPEIIALIERLVAKGHAYPVKTAKGNDVYFAVRTFDDYGKLSKRNLDDLRAGERVEVGESKKDPLDFALWKGDEDPTALGWASPWGRGRPGWHIECSAMAEKCFGPHFDIHGGGMNIIFPHHENEIAQSEAVNGAPFSKYWLHTGFLNVDKEKMSKSLGNFVTIEDVLSRNDPEALRYYFLGTHYRGPLQFEIEKRDDGRVVFPSVDEAERRMDYLYSTRDALVAAAEGKEAAVGNVLQGQGKTIDEAPAAVLGALDKDLNTPVALSVIAELAKAANEVVVQIGKLKKDKAAQDAARQLAAKAVLALDGCCKPLGIMQAKPEDYAARTRARRLKIRGLEAGAIDAKVRERTEARAAKDFAKADALRVELDGIGVELLDATGGGSTWRLKA